jgi:endogenous inhibitor of DNA gyrase (YacG/DUF329 family)
MRAFLEAGEDAGVEPRVELVRLAGDGVRLVDERQDLARAAGGSGAIDVNRPCQDAFGWKSRYNAFTWFKPALNLQELRRRRRATCFASPPGTRSMRSCCAPACQRVDLFLWKREHHFVPTLQASPTAGRENR